MAWSLQWAKVAINGHHLHRPTTGRKLNPDLWMLLSHVPSGREPESWKIRLYPHYFIPKFKKKKFCVLKHKDWFLYMVHCRKLRDQIKAKMTEKQKLKHIMTKDSTKRHTEPNSLSTLFPDFIVDIPSLSIPQLQVCVACTVLTQCLQSNILDWSVPGVKWTASRIVTITGRCQ
jgi:hypothetical protein